MLKIFLYPDGFAKNNEQIYLSSISREHVDIHPWRLITSQNDTAPKREIKSIHYYDAANKRMKQINLDH